MDYIRIHESLPLLPGKRVQAVIDTAALADNYRALLARVQAASPKTRGIAVVKADAYGHGIRPAVGALLGAGCRSFAVACLEEAVALRRLLRTLLRSRRGGRATDTDTDVLVLGYVDPENAPILAAYRITATLISPDYTERLLACARAARVTVRVHAALDTGMNRIGYPAHTDEEIQATVDTLLSMFGGAGDAGPSGDTAHRLGRKPADARGGLLLDGLYTHFARADEDYDIEMRDPDSLTMTQYRRYRLVLEALVRGGVTPRLCHVCNSAAAVRFPDALPEGCLDAVRLGIHLYGYGVEDEDAASVATRPAMRLETVVTHVHTLLPGESVGYGGTYTADTPRTLATLPVGYADGWLRAFSGASVTLHTPAGDVAAPIVGRICMDQCMVDVTDLPVSVGTPVTLFGATPDELRALAARAGTIPYELLCLISARIPRVFE